MLPPSLISFCQYCHFHSYSSHSWLSDTCDNLTASPLAYTLQWLPVLGEEASIQRATVPSQPGLAHLSSLISFHSSPNDKSSAIFLPFPKHCLLFLALKPLLMLLPLLGMSTPDALRIPSWLSSHHHWRLKQRNME